MYPNYSNQGYSGPNSFGGFPSIQNNFGFDGLSNYPTYHNNSQYPPAIGFGFPEFNTPNQNYQNSFPNYPPPPIASDFSSPYQPSYLTTNQNFYPSTYTDSNSSFPPYQPASLTYPSGSFGNYNQNLYPNLIVENATNSNYNQNFQNTYYEGTVRPHHPFNPADDAARLYKAMKGFGTDETALIDILCRRTSQQRQEIAMCFKTGYGKDLLTNLKSETSGNFQNLFKALLFTPVQLEAHDLKKAIEGLGTDEISLIDIICTKTNAEMNDLKMTYRQMFNRNLEQDVGGDVSGYFKRFLISLSAAHRSDAPPNYQKAVQQAKELYKAGEKRLGTDEVTFNRIFASESFPHLKLVFQEYQKLTGHDIDKAIKSEMSGDVERAFLAVAGIAKNPPAYYAERLYQTMKGLGTNDRQLIRLMVLRSEKDMVQIKNEFQKLYGKTLESFIKGDCSGDYKKGLLCLAGDSNWK